MIRSSHEVVTKRKVSIPTELNIVLRELVGFEAIFFMGA